MRYKLIGNNDCLNPIKTILSNRGIEKWKEYIGLQKSDASTFKMLDNIDKAVECFAEHFEYRRAIGILSDTDTDGIASSVMMYKYIKDLDTDYDVRLYVHHKNKSHGLNDKDFDIEDDIKLLIVPDAGTNDVKNHIEFHERGIDCIVLDHHVLTADISNSPAIIVNNQISKNYKNKNCCGASVTMEFCRALDDYYWEYYGDQYVDLAGIANISDVMSLSEFETRAIVNEGLMHIKNKMLLEIIKAQDFSMKGHVNPHTIAFYVTPLINSFLRIATLEEREMLLRAFCEIEDETFEYTKRGSDEPTEENIYEHCVRLMKSYKGKQDRQRDKSVKEILSNLEGTDNKVEIIDATDIVDKAMAGLAAIRVSETINKPVLMLKRAGNSLAGSGRAFNNCPIEDFRKLVEDCPYSTLAAGHPSAFGAEIKEDKLQEAIDWFNEQLKDVSLDKVYTVDFLLGPDDVSVNLIKQINDYQDLWCHGVDEPLIAVTGVKIHKSDIRVQGKNYNSVAFTVNGIKYVQFNMEEDDALLEFASDWDDNPDKYVVVDVVGEPSVNEYKGIYTPQISIKCSEVTAQN